jgi:hypothetical protein
MSRRSNMPTIYSIFGQVDAAAAEWMISNGKGRKIPFDQIPEGMQVNPTTGTRAQFALMLYTKRAVHEFLNHCEDLYA